MLNTMANMSISERQLSIKPTVSVIHHCVFTIAMVVLLLIFIYLLMYLFIYVKKEFIVHTVIYQLSPLKTEFKSIQF